MNSSVYPGAFWKHRKQEPSANRADLNCYHCWCCLTQSAVIKERFARLTSFFNILLTIYQCVLGSNFHFILFLKFSFFQEQIFFLQRSWSQCSFKSRYYLVLCNQPSLSNNLRQPLRQTNEHLTQKPRLLKWLFIIVLRNCSPYPSFLTMSQLELNMMMMMMYSASQIWSK